MTQEKEKERLKYAPHPYETFNSSSSLGVTSNRRYTSVSEQATIRRGGRP